MPGYEESYSAEQEENLKGKRNQVDFGARSRRQRERERNGVCEQGGDRKHQPVSIVAKPRGTQEGRWLWTSGEAGDQSACTS